MMIIIIRNKTNTFIFTCTLQDSWRKSWPDLEFDWNGTGMRMNVWVPMIMIVFHFHFLPPNSFKLLFWEARHMSLTGNTGKKQIAKTVFLTSKGVPIFGLKLVWRRSSSHSSNYLIEHLAPTWQNKTKTATFMYYTVYILEDVETNLQ